MGGLYFTTNNSRITPTVELNAEQFSKLYSLQNNVFYSDK